MPLNYIDNNCKTSSSDQTFGLCDDPHPAKNPAYIDEVTPANWIATVNNPRQISADFHAIDHCVTVKRPNGDIESRCDGLLLHDTNLTFIELKDRAAKGWLIDGVGQLTVTHGLFMANHDMTLYTQVEAYVANKQRPLSSSSYKQEMQKFKTATGITLKVQSTIEI